MPLQTELRFHSRGYEQPQHRRACGTTNSGWLAGDLCCSSDNNLRLGRQDSSGDGPRANATAGRLSFVSPRGGREPAIKAKELEAQSVGDADGVVGGETFSGYHHLSTNDCGHLPTNTAPASYDRPKAHRQVLTPVLATRTRTGRSQNMSTTLAAYDVLCDPRCSRPQSPGRSTECYTLARQQQFAFPCMAGGCLLRRAGGWFPPPDAGGRSESPAHAEAGPDLPRPPPQLG
jgi:hypothetical protein